MPEDHVNPENFPESEEDLKRIIGKVLAPKLRKIAALEDERDSALQERDQFKSTVAERDTEISGLKSTVGERERALLVTKVAHKKNVPAKYLSGESEEELEAAADEFLNDVRSLGGGKPGEGDPTAQGGEQGAQGQQQQGHVPSAGTGGEKPQRPTYDERKQAAFQAEKAKQQKGVLL